MKQITLQNASFEFYKISVEMNDATAADSASKSSTAWIKYQLCATTWRVHESEPKVSHRDVKVSEKVELFGPTAPSSGWIT